MVLRITFFDSNSKVFKIEEWISKILFLLKSEDMGVLTRFSYFILSGVVIAVSIKDSGTLLIVMKL
jgi:hypothetical protein